jgi:hypothetical protein
MPTMRETPVSMGSRYSALTSSTRSTSFRWSSRARPSRSVASRGISKAGSSRRAGLSARSGPALGKLSVWVTRSLKYGRWLAIPPSRRCGSGGAQGRTSRCRLGVPDPSRVGGTVYWRGDRRLDPCRQIGPEKLCAPSSQMAMCPSCLLDHAMSLPPSWPGLHVLASA